MNNVIYYLFVVNIATFVIFGFDKYMAIKQRWRVSERRLMTLAIAGGSVGALCAMYLLRHKTAHSKFKIGIPLVLCLQLSIAIYFLF